MHLNHLKTATPSGPVCGKNIFHETSSWCQKDWGLLFRLWSSYETFRSFNSLLENEHIYIVTFPVLLKRRESCYSFQFKGVFITGCSLTRSISLRQLNHGHGWKKMRKKWGQSFLCFFSSCYFFFNKQV